MEFLRRRLGLILRLSVTGLLLAWMIPKVDWNELRMELQSMEVVWILLALFFMLFVLVFPAWRWQLLLRAQTIYLPFYRALELTMIGQYFNAMLVGTTGGDVVRVFYAARLMPKNKICAVATVVLDRLIGMVILLAMGATGALAVNTLLCSTTTTRYATMLFYLFAAAGILAAGVGWFLPLLPGSTLVRELLLKVMKTERGTLLWNFYLKAAQAWGINFLVIVISFLSHFVNFCAGYCLLKALHLQPPVVEFFAIFLVVNFVIALPISISGFGVRETLFIAFLALIHLDQKQALAFSLTFFGLGLFWSFLGGLVYLLYRHETHEPKPSTHLETDLLESVSK